MTYNLLQREHDGKRGAASGFAFHGNAATVYFDKLFGDRQPDTAPLVYQAGRQFGLEEALEYLFFFIGRNTDSRIGHAQAQPSYQVVCYLVGLDRYGTVLRGELECVG